MNSRTLSSTRASYDYVNDHVKDPPTGESESAHPPLVNVRASQNKQPASSSADPRQELCEEVRDHHPQACLYILQRKVLGIAATVYTEARSHARHDLEERPERSHDSVHVQISVVARTYNSQSNRSRCAQEREDRPADSVGEIFCTCARVRAGVFRAHVTRVHDPPTQLPCIRRDVIRSIGLAYDPPRIRNHLRI
jgi:hypothetical protein